MNTIQIEEESTIISLKRLNEMKENEKIFMQGLSDPQRFLALYQTGRWDQRNRVFFLSHEWEVSQAMIEHNSNERIKYEKEISELKVEIIKLKFQVQEFEKIKNKISNKFYIQPEIFYNRTTIN